jgi:hypothetical protein
MRGRRWLIAGLLAGALLRGVLLPLPGTGDVLIWKVWSFAAAHDVTGVYGVGGVPPERRVLRWQGAEMTVDYPPVALYQLGVVGRIYHAARPLFDDSRWLTAAVKLPGILAELALLVVLYQFCRRYLSEAAARWSTLAVWLNPAVLLDGAALGYLDSQMAVPAVLATLAAWSGHPVWAGVLMAAAVLTKAQAVFVLPLVAVLVWRIPGIRIPGILGFLITTAVVVLPFILRGAWDNLLQALSRLAHHDMLSAQAANIWWLFTWALRVQDGWPESGAWAALTQEVRILGISRAVALGYPNARIVGMLLVGGALLWACVRARRVVAASDACALAAWSCYAYALLAAQVHENHLAPAVLLLAPAAALEPAYRRVFWLLTAVVSLNLYLFYGLGIGWPPIVSRSVTIIDATVVLSTISVAAFGWLTAIIARRSGVSPGSLVSPSARTYRRASPLDATIRQARPGPLPPGP